MKNQARLNPTERLTLLIIDRLEGEHATYEQMADMIGIGRSTFAEVIKTLKARGLVSVSGSRRFPQRTLTSKGRLLCRGLGI